MSAIAAIPLGCICHTSQSLSSPGSRCRPSATAHRLVSMLLLYLISIGESAYHSNELFLEFLCQEVAELLRNPISGTSPFGDSRKFVLSSFVAHFVTLGRRSSCRVALWRTRRSSRNQKSAG